MTELRHDQCVAREYLPTDHTPRGDTHLFPFQIESPDVAARLSGLSPQAIELAANPFHLNKLRSFYEAYVKGSSDIPAEHIRGLIGHNGSLVSIRRTTIGDEQNTHLAYDVVISHLEDPNEPSVQEITCNLLTHPNATTETVYLIGGPSNTLRDVPQSADQLTVEVVQTVDRALAVERQPRVIVQPYMILYLRSDGHIEQLFDIDMVAERCEQTVRRLAEVSFAAGNTHSTSGHLSEKVVA